MPPLWVCGPRSPLSAIAALSHGGVHDFGADLVQPGLAVDAGGDVGTRHHGCSWPVGSPHWWPGRSPYSFAGSSCHFWELRAWAVLMMVVGKHVDRGGRPHLHMAVPMGSRTYC